MALLTHQNMCSLPTSSRRWHAPSTALASGCRMVPQVRRAGTLHHGLQFSARLHRAVCAQASCRTEPPNAFVDPVILQMRSGSSQPMQGKAGTLCMFRPQVRITAYPFRCATTTAAYTILQHVGCIGTGQHMTLMLPLHAVAGSLSCHVQLADSKGAVQSRSGSTS